MGAVAKSTDVAEASVLSFLAGCDFLLTGKTDYRTLKSSYSPPGC